MSSSRNLPHYKDAVRLFHDRVIEGDARQFAEAVTQSVLEVFVARSWEMKSASSGA